MSFLNGTSVDWLKQKVGNKKLTKVWEFKVNGGSADVALENYQDKGFFLIGKSAYN